MNRTASDGGSLQTDAPVVLVVDDEPGLADLYAAWLGDSYETRIATGGEEALDQLDETVDVVLLDRRMPTLSGDDVLEEINARGLGCGVAMVTAVDPDFDILDMGFDDYLTKPVSQDDLRSTVESIILRGEYDATLNELYALSTKRAALRRQKAPEELAAHAEYQELIDRIEVLKAQSDDLVTDLDTIGTADVFNQLRSRNLGVTDG